MCREQNDVCVCDKSRQNMGGQSVAVGDQITTCCVCVRERNFTVEVFVEGVHPRVPRGGGVATVHPCLSCGERARRAAHGRRRRHRARLAAGRRYERRHRRRLERAPIKGGSARRRATSTPPIPPTPPTPPTPHPLARASRWRGRRRRRQWRLGWRWRRLTPPWRARRRRLPILIHSPLLPCGEVRLRSVPRGVGGG